MIRDYIFKSYKPKIMLIRSRIWILGHVFEYNLTFQILKNPIIIQKAVYLQYFRARIPLETYLIVAAAVVQWLTIHFSLRFVIT